MNGSGSQQSRLLASVNLMSRFRQLRSAKNALFVMPRSVFFVSLVFLSIHLAIAAWLPLFDDEAYCALWARDLAAGYYDHPPMIAYMIRFGTSLIGETAFGIRLVSVICFSAAGYLVGDIARISGDRPVMPVLATTLYNLNLLVLALGSFATPDAPSTLFWVAALWVACRAVTPSARTGSQMLWWLGTGVLVGLGCLSKFTNALLAVGLLAYLFSSAKGRSYLLTHLPFVAMAAAVLPLIPYFLWNLQNDWLGLQRQGARLIATGFSMRYLWEYATLLFLAPTQWSPGSRSKPSARRQGMARCWFGAQFRLCFTSFFTQRTRKSKPIGSCRCKRFLPF
jgi:4-amino-4-deoxy-L-arabinose transferase-like glycosyltransferase